MANITWGGSWKEKTMDEDKARELLKIVEEDDDTPDIIDDDTVEIYNLATGFFRRYDWDIQRQEWKLEK